MRSAPRSAALEPIDAIAGPRGFVRVSRVERRGSARRDADAGAPPFGSIAVLAGRRDGGRPSHRGAITAFLAAGSQGIDGWIESGGVLHMIGSGPHASRASVAARLARASSDPAPDAGVPAFARRAALRREALEGYAGKRLERSGQAGEGGLAGAVCRTATIAIETDHEFLADLFGGDTAAASEYAVTLLAASSEIFARDCDAQFQVNFVRLWETADDPWTSANTSDQLFQWRDWWVANMAAQPRTVAHFLSGRGLGGGIAWLPGTCSLDYGYGLSANLGGFFPYPLEDHNGQNWDVVVVTHELGHNFGAPHTHSMVPPIDGCGNGDCSDAYSGTIMSYCHTCPGGMTNISLKFAPGTIETILAQLDSGGAACIPSGDDPVAVDDLASTIAGAPTTIDVLANDLAASCAGSLVLEDFDVVSIHGGTIALCAGCGAEGRDALTYTPPAAFSGIDGFGYKVSAGTANIATGATTVDVQALLPATTPSIPRAGLVASYYALPDVGALPDFTLLSPISSEVVAQVDYPSTGGVFAGSGLADLVGAVFEGYVEAPVDGVYTLSLESDDGSRMLVDGQTVVSNDGLHGMLEKSGAVALAAGAHVARIEFFERFGGAGLIARIAGPSLPKQVVPASLFMHEGTADLNGDGLVDGADLGLLLGAWGTNNALADLNGDGTVDGADLGLLLGDWNP
ncbi:MAG: M12 family metallo-peptidase [Phycisphaerales bacterium]